MQNLLSRIQHKIYRNLPYSIRYRQGKAKNILLFANRRGGSTIMAHLLTVDPGTRIIDQPFDLFPYPGREEKLALKRSLIPDKPASQFIHLHDQEIPQVLDYVDKLMKGYYPAFDHYVNGKRTLLKIVYASPLMDFMAEHFPVHIVYLNRHPIPQALSVVRNQWEITAYPYLQTPEFSSQFLSDTQVQFGLKLLERGSELEKAVLNWCLENHYPLHHAKAPFLHITYEELLLNPDIIVNLLSRELEIKNRPKMFEVLGKPSVSYQFSEGSTNQAILKKDTQYLLNGWQSKVTEEQKAQVQQILDVFECSVYSAYRLLPEKAYLHAPESLVSV